MGDFFLVSKCVHFDSDLPDLFTNSWIFCLAILQHFQAKNLADFLSYSLNNSTCSLIF